MRIAIVGAGIGGLTAALALAGDAEEILLFERRTGFGETGAGIQLSPNASRVLISLGLEGAIRRIGSRPDRMVVRSLRSGREIGAVDLESAEERFGAPYLYVARSDLHTVLLDAVRRRPNVKLRVGRSLTSLKPGQAGVELTFQSERGSAEEVTADLTVGADGLRSPTRSLLGDTRPLRPSGYAAFRATVPRSAIADDVAAAGGLWLGRGAHVVHYPIAEGGLVNVVAVARRSGLDLDQWSTTVARNEVGSALGQSAAEPLSALLAAAESWSAWPLGDLPVRSMASGRVALVGDAAHPTLPFAAQGAALAIEDAAVLAASLRGPASNTEAALQSYAKARRSRAARVQAAARRQGRAYHAGGLVAFVRNRVMGRLGSAGMLERQAWIYGWRPDA